MSDLVLGQQKHWSPTRVIGKHNSPQVCLGTWQGQHLRGASLSTLDVDMYAPQPLLSSHKDWMYCHDFNPFSRSHQQLYTEHKPLEYVLQKAVQCKAVAPNSRIITNLSGLGQQNQIPSSTKMPNSARQCKSGSCRKRSLFGHRCDPRPSLCGTHKEAKMVDLTHPTCRHTGCLKFPNYALGKGHGAQFCTTHKLLGMISLTKKCCQLIPCLKTASFAMQTEVIPRFCGTHKQLGMRNVVSRRCEDVGCQKHSSFGLGGKAPYRFCATHKLPGMEARSYRWCKETGCKKTAQFARQGESKATLCTLHQFTSGARVKQKKREHAQKFPHTKQQSHKCHLPIKRSSEKSKEKHVMAHVKAILQEHLCGMQFDRPIKRCSRTKQTDHRPDLWWDLGTHGLVLEVDENQHVGYSKKAEFDRINKLQADAGKPVIFLRFNPDKYTDSQQNKHMSCFHKAGVPSEQQASWKHRLDVLLERMLFLKDPIPRLDVTEEKLFFNGHSQAGFSTNTLMIS